MQLSEKIEKRIAYEKMLSEISENAASIDNLDNYIRSSLEKMGIISEVTRVFLFGYEASTDIFHCHYGWDSPLLRSLQKPDEIQLHIPWARRQFAAGHILNYSDINEMPGTCYRKRLSQMHIKSTLNFPLFVKGSLYGFIGFDEHRYHRKWLEEDVYILTTAAQIITHAIENKTYEYELEQHRSLLESIFSSVQDAIIAVDTSMKIIEANKTAEILCGIDIVKGKIFTECTRKCANACACATALHSTLHDKTSVRECRIQCPTPHDRPMVAMMNCSPLHNRDGTFMGAVLVIRDITRLTSLENTLHKREKFHNIIGNSPEMGHIYSLLHTLSSLATTVLITGESGTGKEMVAQALHYGGQRAGQPFVKVNCSALAENLLESELFGHVKGAFTGADKDTMGRFEAAGAGTILLDEIGDISPLIQLKLLRVLQEKEFERVGEFKARKLQARVLTSTNRDLKKCIQQGSFREDLYYRLNVMDIHIPPLRERREDIPLLIEHFLKRFNAEYQKHIEDIEPESLALLLRYPWPGNIRELEHALERAVILCPGHSIQYAHLPVEITAAAQPPLSQSIDPNSPHTLQNMPSDNLPSTYNLEHIRAALAQSGGNVSKAARLLHISRWTLYRKMHQFGLKPPHHI